MITRLRTLASIVVATGLIAVAQTTAPKANLRAPLDIPLLLSGNFGELRTNHFHSGIDFKTQGRTGIPVHCAADGYVSRVAVSPWGFGRAVYVTHPELGLTTVYGHLESFATNIDTPVRNKQYENKSFRIDISFNSDEIPVKRGDIIGRSGNSGSSGGPHLHMDVRDAATEHALDPLAYYCNVIKDDVKPEVRALALYPREGLVDGSSKPVYHHGKALSTPFTAWGRVVPGIKAYDRMTGTTNIYGIKYMTLMCDGDTIYHRIIDEVDFDHTRDINTLIEYGDVIDSNSWFMTTEIPESNPLKHMVKATGDGSLYIDEERNYKLKFILRDQHGNTTQVPFVIKGVRADIPPTEGDGELIAYDRDKTLTTDCGATVTIPAGTLYSDCIVNVIPSDANDERYLSRRYLIGDKHIPLSRNYTLSIPLTKETLVDKRHYIIARLDGNKPAAIESTYNLDGTVSASVNRFGTYTIMSDTIPPTIKPINPDKWKVNKRVTYKISDNFAGIDSYTGEIDGEWCLFEYDGKTGTLSYKFDNKRMPQSARHRVNITVTDAAGNTATHTHQF